jgi:predicted MFS family arabinose efflux permease
VLAQGIGRFAFTPILPMMQQDAGLSVAQGGWLASANYLGYLVGALWAGAARVRAAVAVRAGLAVIAFATLAMALDAGFAAWALLRFVAGVASACVLVGVSGWALAALGAHGKAGWSGGVFSGVGIGIALAGIAGLVAGIEAVAPATVWLLLGAASAAVVAIGWLPLSADATAAPPKAAALRRWSPGDARLVAGYGAFGFGYIIPATFIPAMASKIVDNPWMFGWAWPFFGAAAAASTVVVTRHFQNTPPRTVATWSLLIMAVGVLLPAITRSIAMIIAASLCVGGTFMVMTIAGFQEARRLSSAPPARLIAAMTAAFAIGQLIGPMLVGIGSQGDAVAVPSFVACAVLIASAIALRYGPRR